MTTERRRCGGCRREVIAGLTASGFDVTLDPIELDPATELATTVAGGRTYTHHTWADRITHRDARAIRARPAGTQPRQAVRPAHDCARAWPTPPPADRAPRDEGGGVDDPPPF
jgi:hypothetical protein